MTTSTDTHLERPEGEDPLPKSIARARLFSSEAKEWASAALFSVASLAALLLYWLGLCWFVNTGIAGHFPY